MNCLHAPESPNSRHTPSARIPAGFALAALGCLVVISLPASANDVPPLVKERGYQLFFMDDFKGSGLDVSKWDNRGYASLLGDDGSTNDGFNRELQWYRPEQASVKDGRLLLTLEKREYVARRVKADDPRFTHLPSKEGHPAFPYVSGAVSTKNKVAFSPPCYIEVEARVPGGVKGTWPAIWLLPEPDGWPPEIDILEHVGAKEWPGNEGLTEEDNLYCNVHWRKTDGTIGSGPFGHLRVPGLPKGFHKFAVHWTPDRVTFYFDDKEWHTLSNTSEKKIPDIPCYLILNLACGGNWPGSPDNASEAKLPVAFEIERVRAWKENEQK
jgi:beta-glucanase (GH16 family)